MYEVHQFFPSLTDEERVLREECRDLQSFARSPDISVANAGLTRLGELAIDMRLGRAVNNTACINFDDYLSGLTINHPELLNKAVNMVGEIVPFRMDPADLGDILGRLTRVARHAISREDPELISSCYTAMRTIFQAAHAEYKFGMETLFAQQVNPDVSKLAGRVLGRDEYGFTRIHRQR